MNSQCDGGRDIEALLESRRKLARQRALGMLILCGAWFAAGVMWGALLWR